MFGAPTQFAFRARLALALVAAAFAVVALVTPSLAQSRPSMRDVPIAAEMAVTISAARLAEPLAATKPTTDAEDRALSLALEAYRLRAQPEDISALVGFVAAHPRSGWASGVHLNIGLSSLHYGYFSSALSAFESAWMQGKDAKGTAARALVDRAVAELARLYSSFGHTEHLSRLFDEIGDRKVSGSATELIQVARETLDLVTKDPRHLFICGPTALRALALKHGLPAKEVAFLRWFRASPDGTSLAELSELSDKIKFDHRLVFRSPGQDVPVPAIVHWKVGHFATILREVNGRFEVEDPVFPGRTLWIVRDALDQEASGYFLTAANTAGPDAWRRVELAEATRIWGKGPTAGTEPNLTDDEPVDEEAENPEPGNVEDNDPDSQAKACPLCRASIRQASVSVVLWDQPVGYTPQVGPSVKIRITYNQREASQPQNFNFFNVSPKWTLNWLAYVTDDPANPGGSVSRFMSAGGAITYSGYSSDTKRFAAQTDDGSVLVLTSSSPITYRRQKRDGAVEVYAQSDGSIGFPRRVFLSQIIDPRGNAVTLNYDGQLRLASLTDASGRQTTFSYDLISRPLLVTRITDPFGRYATLTYDDDTGRLTSITDIIGLTSSFTYDANLLVNTLTTPYGTTTLAYTAPGTSGPPRFAQITDPMGFSKRVEWLEPAPVVSSEPANNVPQGMPTTLTNAYLDYRNSFYWDRAAYAEAGCTPAGGCDYTKARTSHYTHVGATTNIKSSVLESTKRPYENRVWFSYDGQALSIDSGAFNSPTAIGRVLDDGSSQVTRFTYDSANYFNTTSVIDPVGRQTLFTYANGIDLLAVTQITENGFPTTVAQYTYNYQHRPLTYTDAAGQTTRFTYNAAGQITSATNALDQTTSYQYDGLGRLSTVTNANNAVVATYTYDAFDRIETFTDSEGWTANYLYDAADRPTKTTYPDGTVELRSYDKLDLATFTDRLGRTWTYTHDTNRRLTKIRDPLGQETLFGYDQSGRRTTLTDPKGDVTRWTYDVQGRVIAKRYADGSIYTYVYEATTSRLKAVIDPLGQRKEYSYFKDDRLAGLVYLNAINPTPSVAFAYDPYFPRLVSMADGIGTTQYTYVPVGMQGALSPFQETGPLPSSSITHTYDVLGRLSTRTVAGSGVETVQYDAIGRVTGNTNDMGSFTLSYLGQTGQIAQRQLVSSSLSTTWTYLNNAGDRRLASIANVGLTSGHFSTFQYTSAPENILSSITELSDSASVYPAQGQQTAGYNALNQLKSLQGQPTLTYNANGNLTSDAQRTFTWDAEDRLIGISYPAQPGKQTTFIYDGLGRRVTVTSTPPGGGGATTTSYIWCGSDICQSRDGTNTVTRGYSGEGEFVPGSPPQRLYYGTDQLTSVRRVFASTVNAPAYSFGPYGEPLQGTTPLTDFGFAGMLYNADSGLYLTNFRAYDPVIGRWLSRDPLGEDGDPFANLYAYVGGSPTVLFDPLGLMGMCPLPKGPDSSDDSIATAKKFTPGSPCLNPCNCGGPIIMACGGSGRGGGGGTGGQRKTPNTGPPGTTHVNPGSKQERTYGPDGRPAYDIDWDHSHRGSNPVGKPHGHNWDDGVRGPAVPLSPWPRGRLQGGLP